MQSPFGWHIILRIAPDAALEQDALNRFMTAEAFCFSDAYSPCSFPARYHNTSVKLKRSYA